MLTVLLALMLVATTASAEPQGYVEDEYQYGFFYGTPETFQGEEGLVTFAGGPAEAFCDGDPGTATARMFFRQDGSIDLKVDAKDQPIWVYETDLEAMELLDEACTSGTVPDAFATGTAALKVRMTINTDGSLAIFNSINGTAIADDGSGWKVRGSADFGVDENGGLIGNPEEFVVLEIRQIGR
jgi:hypothetical protein